MSFKLKLLILALLITIILSAPTSPSKSHSLSPNTSSFPSPLLATGPLSTTTPLLFPPDELTQALPTNQVSARQKIQRRKWSKEQVGVFVGFMVPLGALVVYWTVAIFFGGSNGQS
jgi:hypothetical protein